MADTLPETPPPCNVDTLVEHLFGPRPEYRAAIGSIAEKARAVLPECNGRVDAAVKMVLAGDVELLADGTAKVGSASDPTAAYEIVSGRCDCADFARAPHGFCKHRLSAAIARRARELTLTQTPASSPVAAPAPVLPEAPASVNVRLIIGGRDCQFTLRDTDEGRLVERLDALLARYPVEGTSTASVPAPMQQPPVCRWHGAMKPSTKGKGFYCPAKMADDTYCQERA